MAAVKRTPPIWLLGLTNATFGMMNGFSFVTLLQLLAGEGVPGGRIAAISAAIGSPAIFGFVFSPMLDVRFRRRTYALLFAALSALAAAIAVVRHGNPQAVELVMLVGYLCVTFYAGAVGGWMGSLIDARDDGRLASWFNVANIAGSGVMVIVGGPIILHAPPLGAAAFVFVALLLPIALFPFIPAPPPDKVLAAESFGRFGREVVALLARREVLIGLALFALPSASFSLTNVLGGLGSDYHASAATVSLFAGAGSILAGICGSFLLPQLAGKIPLRPLYLATGVLGALFTFSALLLPRTPAAFGVVFTGEQIFQALAFTTVNGITFQVIGPKNPLAATLFSLLMAAMNLPLTYMGVVDGWGYDRGGLVGSFTVDACSSLAACLLLALALRRWLFQPVPHAADSRVAT